MKPESGSSSTAVGSNPSSWSLAWLTALQILLLLLQCAPSAQAADRGGSIEPGAAEISYLVDAEDSMGIREISSEQLSSSFTNIYVPRGMEHVRGSVWVRVTVPESTWSGKTLWLQLATPTVDEARLYIPDESEEYVLSKVIASNDLFAQRDIPYRTPVFKLSNTLQNPYTVYLRLKSDDAMVVGPKIWEPEDFVAHISTEQFVMGVFAAIHLMTALGFLWLWQRLKETIYPLIALFVVSSLVLLMITEGYFLQFSNLELSGSLNHLKLISWIVSHTALIAVVYEALRKSESAFNSVKNHFISVSIMMLVMMGLLQENNLIMALKLFRIGELVSLAWLAGLLVQQKKEKEGIRNALIIMMGILFVGAAIRYIRNLGWLPSTTLTDNAFYFAFGAFPILLYKSIVDHYDDTQKTIARILESEMKRAKDTGQKLETLVEQRTAALNEALQISAAALEVKRKSFEEQRNFFATVSHELRTPLSVIDAAAMNLQHDLSSEDEQARLRCGRIRRSVDQLSILIKNCFDVDRHLISNRESRFEEIQARDLVFEAYDAARNVSTSHQIELNINDLPEKLNCDPELTRLALRTLVVNAVKYTPHGTRVEIAGRCEGEDVILEVKDDGRGVSKNELPRLFERYFRGENSIGVPGTGMGLPLARDMVEAQQGTLTVDSSPGKGFTARIRLAQCPGNKLESKVKDEDGATAG